VTAYRGFENVPSVHICGYLPDTSDSKAFYVGISSTVIEMETTPVRELEDQKHLVEHAEAERDVFILIGPYGSGKSTVADMIAEEHDERVSTFEMSDFVRTKFSEMFDGAGCDDNELGEWAANEKAVKGQDYFAREMAKTIKAPHTPHVAISGVRSPEEAVAIRDVFDAAHVSTIAVWTLPDLRFSRKYGSDKMSDPETVEEFQERNERELWEWGAVEFYARDSCHGADYILPNHDSLNDLRNNVDRLLNGVGQFDVNPFPHDDFERVAQYL